MNASELRIGNWVNLYDDFNSQVTGLTNKGKVWCVENPHDEGCAWNTDKIKPIPLTEEWLLKFGFEKLHKDFYLDYLNMTFSFDVKYGMGILLRTHEDSIDQKHIKHVHQLQNLYFALTGEELKIKE